MCVLVWGRADVGLGLVRRAMDEDMKRSAGPSVNGNSESFGSAITVVQTARIRWPETAQNAGVFVVSDDEDDDDDDDDG